MRDEKGMGATAAIRPVDGYAVVVPSGHILHCTVRTTRGDAILAAVEGARYVCHGGNPGIKWDDLLSEGWSTVRVRIAPH